MSRRKTCVLWRNPSPWMESTSHLVSQGYGRCFLRNFLLIYGNFGRQTCRVVLYFCSRSCPIYRGIFRVDGRVLYMSRLNPTYLSPARCIVLRYFIKISILSLCIFVSEIQTFIRFKKRAVSKLSFVLSCRQNVCITSDNPVSSSNEFTSPVNSPESCDGLGKRVRKLSNKYDGFEQPISVYAMFLFNFPLL